MYKKIISLCTAILAVVIITSGCSSSLKDENARLTKEISVMKEKNVGLEKSVMELGQQSKNLNTKLKDLQAKNVSINEKMSKDNGVYPIYSANINSYTKEIHCGTYISEKLSLKNKLDALAIALSEIDFNKLPIEVSEITEIDGKNIAIISLKENEENQEISDQLQFKGESWVRNYFQGSAGGTITSVSLIETFLQKDYEGEWIDGVKFLYNNKICDFQHVPALSKVSFRK